MARDNQRGSNNNNPEGRNQHSGMMDMARERPFTAAAAAAATVGAGVFLWSRRNQISDQISNLSDQIGRWGESMHSSREDRQFETAEAGSSDFSAAGGTSATGSSRSTSRKASRSGTTGSMGEIGGGNASIGAHSGGGGMNPSGRGRA